jgi:N-acetylneuraminic acid mutarotase
MDHYNNIDIYLAPDGKSIIVFGGQNVSSQGTFDAFNDIYVLDTCTLNWSQPQINGNPPSPRAGHEAFVYNNRYMVVLMGKVFYMSLIRGLFSLAIILTLT